MDEYVIVLASCLLPISIATLVSWLLIRKGRTIMGMAAGPGVILLFLVLVYFLVMYRLSTFDKHSTLYNLAVFVDGMLLYLAIWVAVIDAMIALGAAVLLAILYRWRRQRDVLEEMHNHDRAP